MSTTSLKLPDDLKERAVAAAKRQGITTHAFMVEAIKMAAKNAEDRVLFVDEARAARKAMLKSGEGFDAGEVHAYIRVRAAGETTARPKAKPWRA